MKNFTLTQLTYALALEENRNFGLAAKKCHVSQPTLSMQIQKLEEELGVALFDRSKQPVVPTAAGQKILDQAKRVFREARQIEELVLSEKGEISGEFKLGIIPSLSPYLLPLFLPSFTKQYPKVRLVIDECLTDQLVEKLKRDELDGGLLVTPLHDDGINERPVFYEPFWVYVSETHPLSKSVRVQAGQLNIADLWLLKEGHCFRGQVLQVCSRSKAKSQPLSVRFESGSLDALKSLVDRNFGVTLLPDLAVRQLIGSEQRRRLKSFSEPVPVREVSFVQSRLFSKKAISDVLVKTVKESVPAELTKKQGRSIIDLE